MTFRSHSMRNKILTAIILATLAAAPLQAASTASALSLSPAVRAGESLEGGDALGGVLPLGTWISIALSLVGAYLAIDALSDDAPVSA